MSSSTPSQLRGELLDISGDVRKFSKDVAEHLKRYPGLLSGDSEYPGRCPGVL